MLKETPKKDSEGGTPIAKQITKNDLKKQNKLLIILASIFTGLVVIITSLVLLVPIITSGKEITVPDVTNMSVNDAIKKLQDSGFKISDEQQEQSSSEIEEGHVIKTNPAANSKRTKNTEIILYVSIGDTKITIEDYLGKNYLEIKGALEALGLQVLIEKRDVDDVTKYKDGEIIEQSIKKDEKLSVGDTITLYIPNVISKYPDFTDGTFTIDDVEAFCSEYNIALNVEHVTTSDYADGTIFYQSKPKDYTIIAGQSLTIKVADAQTDTDIDDCSEASRIAGLC